VIRPQVEYCASAWNQHYIKDKKVDREGLVEIYKND